MKKRGRGSLVCPFLSPAGLEKWEPRWTITKWQLWRREAGRWLTDCQKDVTRIESKALWSDPKNTSASPWSVWDSSCGLISMAMGSSGRSQSARASSSASMVEHLEPRDDLFPVSAQNICNRTLMVSQNLANGGVCVRERGRGETERDRKRERQRVKGGGETGGKSDF